MKKECYIPKGPVRTGGVFAIGAGPAIDGVGTRRGFAKNEFVRLYSQRY